MRVGLSLLGSVVAVLLSLAVPGAAQAAGTAVRQAPSPTTSQEQPDPESTSGPSQEMTPFGTTGAVEESPSPEPVNGEGGPLEPSPFDIQPSFEPLELELFQTTPSPSPQPAGEKREQNGLPITGAQVGGMVLLGTGMVAGGVALLTVRRRRTHADLLSAP